MKKWRLLPILAFATMTACENGIIKNEPVLSDHYIQRYCSINEINAVISAPGSGAIYIQYEADYINPKSSQYESLSKRYNDFGYNQYVYPWDDYWAISNEFVGIDVVSDKDFNNIPAGESLGGVVKLVTASAKPYIDSKYTEPYNWAEAPDEYSVSEEFPRGFSPVYGTLDSLDPADLVLLHHTLLSLKFTETPIIKEHNLTITFSDAWNDFSCELAYTFQ